jgi:hypothetical protein
MVWYPAQGVPAVPLTFGSLQPTDSMSQSFQYPSRWDPSAQSGDSKSEQSRQCMDLQHCLHTGYPWSPLTGARQRVQSQVLLTVDLRHPTVAAAVATFRGRRWNYGRNALSTGRFYRTANNLKGLPCSSRATAAEALLLARTYCKLRQIMRQCVLQDCEAGVAVHVDNCFGLSIDPGGGNPSA